MIQKFVSNEMLRMEKNHILMTDFKQKLCPFASMTKIFGGRGKEI